MSIVDDSKTFGRARLSFASVADIDEFVETLERYERGEMTPDQWRAFRLVRGTYGQRQAEDAQMLRVKIPQGILTSSQLDALADVCFLITSLALVLSAIRRQFDLQVGGLLVMVAVVPFVATVVMIGAGLSRRAPERRESRPKPVPQHSTTWERRSPCEQKSRRLRPIVRIVKIVQTPLRRSGSGESHSHHANMQPTTGPRARLCAQSQSGMRSSAINWSTSRRGRTSAHSEPLTITSGTKGRVL